jgi:hypothetical protein
MAEKDPETHESDLARLERRWSELLSELRVTQAGTQIMMGFLLTLVFQPAFGDLDPVERNLYVGLVVTATLATVLAIAPVSFHRILFRHPGGKARIVTITHILLQVTLVLVAFVLSATLALIFNIVLGGWAGVIGGLAALTIIAAIWVALPLGVLRSLAETYRD